MINHFKYKKVTPEIFNKMKKLREQGWSYRKIGSFLNVSDTIVQYHLNEKRREKALKGAKERNLKIPKEKIKEKNKKHYLYQKKYIMERYHKDLEFRRKFIDAVLKYKRKRKKERIKKGLCVLCGGVREDKRFRWCEECRKKWRERGKKND